MSDESLWDASNKIVDEKIAGRNAAMAAICAPAPFWNWYKRQCAHLNGEHLVRFRAFCAAFVNASPRAIPAPDRAKSEWFRCGYADEARLRGVHVWEAA